MKNKNNFGQPLSRNAQRQIKGGTTYYCQRCFRRPGSLFLTVCDMALRICSEPTCGGLCGSNANCFLECTVGEDFPGL
jgi:hypothetical protein